MTKQKAYDSVEPRTFYFIAAYRSPRFGEMLDRTRHTYEEAIEDAKRLTAEGVDVVGVYAVLPDDTFLLVTA